MSHPILRRPVRGRKPGRHAAWLLVSRDGGHSFERPFRVAQHPQHRLYYWDQRLCPTKTAGEFVGLFWTHDLEAKKDLNVHFLRASINMPVTELPRGQLTVSVKDRQGNTTRIERTFTVSRQQK